MKRRLCVLALCVILRGVAVAEEPRQKTEAPATPAATAATPVVSGRKQIESLLRTPAQLDFGQRKQVTAREILDQLHARHGLSLRFDTPTLTSMLGGASDEAHDNTVLHAANETVISIVGALPSAAKVAAPETGDHFEPDGQIRSAPTPPTPLPDAAVATSSAFLADAVPPAAAAAPPPAALPPAATPSMVSEAKETAPRPIYSPVEAAPSAPAPMESKPEVAPAPDATAEETQGAGLPKRLARLLRSEVDLENLDLSRVSVATVLRQTLDAMPTAELVMDEELSGLPVLLTNATLLDYLVEDDGLLITSRMKALGNKETRVYSLKRLRDPCPDEIAKAIRQSIRPWSWRSQINDLGDQLRIAPFPAKTLASILKTGSQLAAEEFDISVAAESDDEEKPKDTSKDKESASAEETKQMEMLANATVNSLVTMAQATISAIEMMHYADPPTGTIQALGKKLVVTQSQAAHREIAELLEQLADE